MQQFARNITFFTCWMLVSVSMAATVYRWQDDQGTVHYSDVVPEKYRGTARPVDATPSPLTDAQQREALARAQLDKSKLSVDRREQTSPPARAQPSSGASRAGVKRPSQVPNEQTDCETWQRLYRESLDCFGPYRTVRGATKPEAFEVCNVVAEPPSTRCRMHIP